MRIALTLKCMRLVVQNTSSHLLPPPPPNHPRVTRIISQQLEEENVFFRMAAAATDADSSGLSDAIVRGFYRSQREPVCRRGVGSAAHGLPGPERDRIGTGPGPEQGSGSGAQVVPLHTDPPANCYMLTD